MTKENEKIVPKGYFKIGAYSYVDVKDSHLEFQTDGECETSWLTPLQTKQLFLSLRNMYIRNGDRFWGDHFWDD